MCPRNAGHHIGCYGRLNNVSSKDLPQAWFPLWLSWAHRRAEELSGLLALFVQQILFSKCCSAHFVQQLLFSKLCSANLGADLILQFCQAPCIIGAALPPRIRGTAKDSRFLTLRGACALHTVLSWGSAFTTSRAVAAKKTGSHSSKRKFSIAGLPSPTATGQPAGA